MVRRIGKAAVIGSGIMGGGIAALLASAGIPTLLLDIVPFDLKDDEKNDPEARNRIVKAGFDAMLKARPSPFMVKKDADLISIGNLEDDFKKLKECDWIVEVVVENLKIKQQLFKKIEKVRKPDAIISTNTSGIPLEKISEGRSDEFKKHFLGTHFFNPVRFMKLLEIIPGKKTKREILDFTAEFGEKVLGKGIVWAKDTPNFIGNRIGVQGMVKSMQLMLEDGLTIPEVDALFGPLMGRPRTALFKTGDLVGLDTLGHVATNCYELCPRDESRDSLKLPDFVSKMIEKNLLGNKTKAGFYKKEKTPDFKTVRKVLNPETLDYEEYGDVTFPCIAEAKKAKTLAEKMNAIVYGDDKGAHYAWKLIASGCIYAANRIPEISATIVEIDNSMKWGYNFEMGPFETWDALGVKKSVARMEKEGYKVPKKVKKMLELGNKSFYKTVKGIKYFYDFKTNSYKEVKLSPNIIYLENLKANKKVVKENKSISLIDLGDGIFCYEFHTKMNSLNSEIFESTHKVVEYVAENGRGLVIGNQAGGMPGAFSAGADLTQILGYARQKKYSDIEAAVKLLQDGYQKLRYSIFPVVAAPFGMALAGGCEVCLASDKIVAHNELFMGLVEFGVGLLPAGCGCLNLWKKFIQSVPDSVEVTDLAEFFLPVFMNIAQAQVSTSAADARAMGFLGQQDRIVFNKDYLIGEAKKEVLKLLDEGYTPPAQRKIQVLGEAAHGMVDANLLNMLAGNYVSEYDAFIAKRIAYVISGGEVRAGSEVAEDTILKLEREAFVDFCKEEKTQLRIEHMLKTGRPLRN